MDVESAPSSSSTLSLKGLHPLFYEELTAYKQRGVVFGDNALEAIRVRGEWYARLARYSLLPPGLEESAVAAYISQLSPEVVAERITELAYAFYQLRVRMENRISVSDAEPGTKKLETYIIDEFDQFLTPIITATQKLALYWWVYNKFNSRGGERDFLKENN